MSNKEEDSVHGGLGYWVGSLASAFRRGVGRELAPFDVTPAQWAILVMCYRGEVNTVSGLARVIPIDQAAISRQVEKLKSKGLIRRRRLSRDRRTVRLDLTDEARLLVPKLARCVEVNEANFLTGISGEELSALIDVIKRMLRNVEPSIYSDEEFDNNKTEDADKNKYPH